MVSVPGREAPLQKDMGWGAAAFWWGAFGGGFCEAAQVALVFIDPPSSSVECHISLSCWVDGGHCCSVSPCGLLNLQEW